MKTLLLCARLSLLSFWSLKIQTSAAFHTPSVVVGGSRNDPRSKHRSGRHPSRHGLYWVTPDQVDSIQNLFFLQHDPAAVWTSASSSLLSYVETAVSTSSQVLAHASASTAAVVDEQHPDASLWDRYLLLFKNTLLLVHSTIDEPLKRLGVKHSWGVSIFLFTAMARTLLLPLSIQQSRSAEYMKALKPYITQISEKFKNNENAKNQAVGRLYADAEQNPLAGCLTSLAQLPIFLGLYRGIRLLALDGELEEPFLWIPSLQGPVSAESDYRGMDWLLQGWTVDSTADGLPFTPSLGWETSLAYLIMPVILVLLQTATMRALAPPSASDEMDDKTKETMDNTSKILKFLPLMIGFFSLQVPAGLTIYWFTSNIFTLSSSLGVRAYFKANPPQINLPDYWDSALAEDKNFADMTPEERRQSMEAGIRVGPTMEELIDESKFHFFVDRRNYPTPLVQHQHPQQQIEPQLESSILIPSELEEWVAAAAAAIASGSRPRSKLPHVDHSSAVAAASTTSSTMGVEEEASVSSSTTSKNVTTIQTVR